MTIPKLILTLILCANWSINNAQNPKDIELKNNKVEIFNNEEIANLQMVFYEKTKSLHLLEDVEADYSLYVIHYVQDMQRLDDKDNDYNEQEIKDKLKVLIDKMDQKVKSILTDEQYRVHKANFNDVMKAVYFKRGWEWEKDF